MTQQILSGIETVRTFYGLMAENRFAEASAYLSSDVLVRETTDLPFGGEYRGHAGNAELVGRMTALFDLAILKSEFFDGGDTVTAKLRARFTPRQSGVPLELEIVELITVRAGKIVELDIYHKTPSAVAAHCLA
jgi:ketosteroid isomerase-like protein